MADFLYAVAAVQEGRAASIGNAAGLDPESLRVAGAMVYRRGVVRAGHRVPCVLTEEGARWADDHYRHARILFAVERRHARVGRRRQG